MRRVNMVLLGMLLCTGGEALAQQVVQQPTIGTFSVNTSVLVPDQGSAMLGGIRSSAAGQTQRGGLYTNKAMGSRSSAGSASISATIIDLQEMDRAILQLGNGSSTLSKQLGSESTSGPSFKVKGMSDSDLDDVHYFLTLAQKARRQGHWASIDVYIQLAKSKIPSEKQTELLTRYGFGDKKELKPGRPLKNNLGNVRQPAFSTPK